ncbi:UNVERIFIED_CONTAM: glycosyltransferase family 4 protein [Halobacillus marinus]
MTKKILIISQNFYPEIGSAGNRMKNIYLMLRESGYEVDVLTTDPTYPNRNFYDDASFWDHEELNDSPDITRVKIRNRKYSRSFFNRLLYYLEMMVKMIALVLTRSTKYDYVYTTSPPIFIAIVGLLAKYKLRAKLILEIRDLWPDSLKGVGVFNNKLIIEVFRWIERSLYKRADEIVVNSKGFINHIEAEEESAADHISYIPNGAREFEIPQLFQAEEPFKVIYAGNLGLAQDNETLLQLAGELKERNIQLTIMGYGFHSQQLKANVQVADLDNVTFRNPATRKECFQLIASHQAGIVTLVDKDVFKTVLPGKIIDYMTCGVPIVGSVSGFSKEVIEANDAGFVVSKQGTGEMIHFIDRLREDSFLQKKMGRNGQQYVKRHFLWEENIKSLIELVEKQEQQVENKLRKVEL